MNSQIYWEPTPYEKPVPPKARRVAGRPKKNRRKDDNEEPVSESQMKRTYNDTQCGMCGWIGHNLRGCNKQGVARRPKDWIDIEPEEENARGNAENVGNVPGNAENHVAENGGGAAENAGNINPENAVVGNDGQVAQNVNVGNVFVGNVAIQGQNVVNDVANEAVLRHV